MPKIDFYILDTDAEQERLLFICKLLEKAYRNKNRVYVNADSKLKAHALDELLWTYKDDSFIPHNLLGEGPDPAPAIQIGFDALTLQHKDVLINLCEQVPEFYTQFNRVIEIITRDTAVQASGRERYKQYRAAGFDIKTHKLSTVA